MDLAPYELYKRVRKCLEGRAGSLQAGPQHGALPADPEKCAQLRAVEIARDLPTGLAFGKARCDARLPPRPDAIEFFAKALREGGHLLAEVADQATSLELVPLDAGARIGNEVEDPLQGRPGRPD